MTTRRDLNAGQGAIYKPSECARGHSRDGNADAAGLQLPQGHDTADHARRHACAETCRARYGLSRHTAYMGCLKHCPGATHSASACGDDERPPAAACVDDGELGRVAKVAVVVGAIVFVAADAVGLGADSIDDAPP